MIVPSTVRIDQELAYDGVGWRYLRGDTVAAVKLPGAPRARSLATLDPPAS